MNETLYLDTARIGQISHRAAAACCAATELANKDPGRIFCEVTKLDGKDSSAIPCWRGTSGLQKSVLECIGLGDQRHLLVANSSASIAKISARALFLTSTSVLCTDLIWPRYRSILKQEARRWSKELIALPIRDRLVGLSCSEICEAVTNAFLQAGCDSLFLTGVSSHGFRLPIEQIVSSVKAQAEVRFVAVDGSQEFAQIDHASSCRVADIYLFSGQKWLGTYHPIAFGLYGKPRSRDFIEVTLDRMIQAGEVEDTLLRFHQSLQSQRVDAFQETVSVMPLLAASGAVSDLLSRNRNPNSLQFCIRNRAFISEIARRRNWSVVNNVPEEKLSTRMAMLRHPLGSSWPKKEFDSMLHRTKTVCSTFESGHVRLSLPNRLLTSEELSKIEECLS